MSIRLPILLAYLFICSARAATYSTTVQWIQNNDVETVPYTGTFTLWIPDGVPFVRGVIAIFGGNSNQQFANRHDFGILTASNSAGSGNTNYSRAYGGSGQALLDALTTLAADSGHLEIAHVPLALFGYSMGGQFAYEFAMWKPERTLCFMLNKGGYYYTVNKTTNAARMVPGWLVAGSTDSQFRLDAVSDIASTNRPLGSRWAHAIEWRQGHVVGNTDALFYPLLERVIRTRYPTDQTPLVGPVDLLDPPAEAVGWLGDVTTWKTGVSSAVRYSEFTGDRDRAVWLYDSDMAALWRAFTSSAADGTTPITITASPAGPAVSAGTTITLSCTVNATAFPNVASVSFYNGSQLLGTVAAPGPYHFSWTNVPGGTHGVYALAGNNLGTQRLSRPTWFIASGEVTGMPSAPSHLLVRAVTDTRNDLKWNDRSNNESGFIIERANAGGTFSPIASVGANATAYSDLSPGTRQIYRVKAAGSSNSLPSNEAGADWGIANWRLSHFGSVANSGQGADLADPDTDSLPNRLEFAMGTDPLAPELPPPPVIITEDSQDYLSLEVERSLAAEGIALSAESSGNLTAWSDAVRHGPATEGYLDIVDFNSGAITDSFAINLAAGSSPYSLVASGGLSGSGALDLGTGTTNDTTLVFQGQNYHLPSLAYLEVDLYFRKKATSTGVTALQIALVGAPSIRLNAYDDPGTTEDSYASIRLARNGTALRLETQIKPGDSSIATTANALANIPLTDGNWYHMRASFARTSPTTLCVWGAVYNAFDNASTTVIAGNLGPVELTIPHIANDSAVWIAIRGFSDAGSDLWDNLEIRSRTETETTLWRDTAPLNSAPARFLRLRADAHYPSSSITQ